MGVWQGVLEPVGASVRFVAQSGIESRFERPKKSYRKNVALSGRCAVSILRRGLDLLQTLLAPLAGQRDATLFFEAIGTWKATG